MINNSIDGFSDNALKILNKKPSRIAGAHFNSLNNTYSKENNPTGFVSLSIAENTLSVDVLREKLEHPPFSPSMIQYSEFGGCLVLREAIVELFTNNILKNSNTPILPQQICVGAGCTPLVENIFQTFCNTDEIALIPSPLYSSFEYDAFARFGVKVVAIPMEVFEEGSRDIKEFKITIETLDRLYQEHNNKIKMILLCNPNNPTGHIISREEILEIIDWCKDKSIHIVSDEIYSLSIFNSEAQSKFESIYDIVEGNLGNYIHILSGFSKDFCLNGLRCGYVISQNQNLIRYLNMTASFYLCSNQVQYLIANMIKDKVYLNRFLTTNQNNLKNSYEFTCSQLKKYGIPFIPSSSGLFLTVDLRKCLTSNTFEGEIEIWDKLHDEHRVILSPGTFCKFQDPGYFRLIFTISKDSIEEATKRIAKFYNQFK